jgi:predicted phosphodiesterase
MKVQLISDIHLEYYSEYPGLHYFVKPIADILVLAGDICYYKHKFFLNFFQEASFYFKYVIYVPGNHEYYTNTFVDMNFTSFLWVDNEIENMLYHLSNVKILQKGTFVINNIKFIGTTLWYDTPGTDIRFNNILHTQNDNFILYNNHLMPDPNILYNINRSQYYWLKNEINHSKNYFTIVVTHYLPSEKCISKLFKTSPDNYLFYTKCDSLFKDVNIWMYGHTHVGQQQKIDKALVLSNPKGLPKEMGRYKDYKFNKEYVIDIPFFSNM